MPVPSQLRVLVGVVEAVHAQIRPPAEVVALEIGRMQLSGVSPDLHWFNPAIAPFHRRSRRTWTRGPPLDGIPDGLAELVVPHVVATTEPLRPGTGKSIVERRAPALRFVREERIEMRSSTARDVLVPVSGHRHCSVMPRTSRGVEPTRPEGVPGHVAVGSVVRPLRASNEAGNRRDPLRRAIYTTPSIAGLAPPVVQTAITPLAVAARTG